MLTRAEKGEFMYRDQNDQAEVDAQLLAVNISDDELERAAAADCGQFVNTAFCTQWWVCPV